MTASLGSQRSLRALLVRSVISLLIAGGFVWMFRKGGLPLAPPHAFAHTAWWGLPAFLSLLGVAAFVRVRRWFQLLKPLAPSLRRGRVFGVGLVGFAAIFFAPLRLGELVRPYLLSREEEVTFTQAVGTLASERVIDGLTVVIFTALAFVSSPRLSPLPDRLGGLPIPISLVPGAIAAAATLFTLAFVALAAFYLLRDTARRVVRAVLGVVSVRLADYCSNIVERLAESLALLLSLRRFGAFLRETALYWTLVALAQYCLLYAAGLAPTFTQAVVTLGVQMLGSLLPAGPGFFGPYQVATYTSLAMYHPETEVLSRGAAFVFISYVGWVVSNASTGLVGLLLLWRAPSATTPDGAATSG